MPEVPPYCTSSQEELLPSCHTCGRDPVVQTLYCFGCSEYYCRACFLQQGCACTLGTASRDYLGRPTVPRPSSVWKCQRCRTQVRDYGPFFGQTAYANPVYRRYVCGYCSQHYCRPCLLNHSGCPPREDWRQGRRRRPGCRGSRGCHHAPQCRSARR